MCGITGIFKKNSREINFRPIIEKMNNAIAHRGPDGFGLYVDDFVALGHRRLAIIDIAAGKQPMKDNIGNKIIVYNGEIYNYIELKAKLISQGLNFETNCDTEVLLRKCDLANYSWINEIVGMFAFAIWDYNTKTLLLGRDRLGIKPLYYADLPDAFIFSSEIRSLLEYPGLITGLNKKKVNEYIAFRNIVGNETLFDGIMQLNPGSLLTISAKNPKLKIHQYWNELENCYQFESTEKACYSNEDIFIELFKNSIQSRLISDVPLGTFNSGGVDSSLVTSIVRTFRPQGELHTFSVGFKEPQYDESMYAKIVANKMGTTHHNIIMKEKDYIDNYERALLALEEPLNHPHTVPLLLLCKLAKSYVTVVLTGEGADEVFGGYPRYHIPLFSRAAVGVPYHLHKFALRLATKLNNRKLIKLLEDSQDPACSALNCGRFVPYESLYRVILDNVNFTDYRREVFRSSKNDSTTFLNQLLLYERKTYLQSLLMRLDKVSMASGLEARVPFLDHRLVCWSHHLPDYEKIRLFRGNKLIVKKVASKFLPNEIVQRKKVGFGVPVAEWLRNKKGLGRYLDLLTDQTFNQRGLFKHKEIEKMIFLHINNMGDYSEVLWGLINFELWYRKFLCS